MTASGIHVRPIRLLDLVRLRTMRADAIMPEQAYGPLGLRMPDPRSAMPIIRSGRQSFVAVLEGRVAGLIDLVSDAANHRWLLSRMLTSRHLTGEQAEHIREMVWRELALQGIRAAGAARAKRIHAVLEDDSSVISALLSTGFTEYAQDTVLTSETRPELEPTGIVRRQDPSDVWAVHQLYHLVTPRPVQYAEALTSNYWGRSGPGRLAARGYVVEDGLEIVAHCRVTQGNDGLIFHMMVHPDARDLACPVIQDALADLNGSMRQRVDIIVPDYLLEYISVLGDIGFVQTRRQTRLVKYTVVAQRMQFRGVEELAREVPERIAAGTPTLSYSPSGQRKSSTHNSTRTSQRDYGIS